MTAVELCLQSLDILHVVFLRIMALSANLGEDPARGSQDHTSERRKLRKTPSEPLQACSVTPHSRNVRQKDYDLLTSTLSKLFVISRHALTLRHCLKTGRELIRM